MECMGRGNARPVRPPAHRRPRLRACNEERRLRLQHSGGRLLQPKAVRGSNFHGRRGTSRRRRSAVDELRSSKPKWRDEWTAAAPSIESGRIWWTRRDSDSAPTRRKGHPETTRTESPTISMFPSAVCKRQRCSSLPESPTRMATGSFESQWNVPSAKVDKLMNESLSEKYSPAPAGESGGVHGQSILRTSHSQRAKPAPWSSRWSWIPPWKPARAPFSCISLDAPTLALKLRLRILDSWERWHETRIGSPWKASTFIRGGALTLTRIWRISPPWYDWYPSQPVATCCVKAHD